MRIWISVLALVAIGALTLLVAAKERPRCENCGMYEDTSPTRVVATFTVDGKEAKHHFLCIGCIQEYNVANYEGKGELTALKIMDYPTFGTKSPAMIDGLKAFYLYGTSDLDGSMPPNIAAFATKDAALAAQKKLGGELLQFDAMWAKVQAGGDEAEQANGSDKDTAQMKYVCEMCNYESDSPGTCPHCGMELKEVEDSD